jgi:U3 small nucleolar RNA-associated protein 14
MAPEVQDPKKLLKIVNYQKCQKTVLSQMERWAATDTHLDHHDIMKSQETPWMTISHKRNPSWARELIQDAEKYGAPEGTMRKKKKPKPFSSYMALMCDLIENEPTCFEEATQKK